MLFFFSRNVFKIGQIADRGLRSRRGLRYYIIKDIHKTISDKLKKYIITINIENEELKRVERAKL